MRADDSGRGLSFGQRPQRGNGVIPIDCADRCEARLVGAVVVEGVRHLGQRNRCPGAGHPIGQHRGRRRQPVGTLPADHQRGHRRRGHRQSQWGLGGLLQHHMGVGPAEAE